MAREQALGTAGQGSPAPRARGAALRRRHRWQILIGMVTALQAAWLVQAAPASASTSLGCNPNTDGAYISNDSGSTITVAGGGNSYFDAFDWRRGWPWSDNAPRYVSSLPNTAACMTFTNGAGVAPGATSFSVFSHTESLEVNAGCVMRYYIMGGTPTTYPSPTLDRVEDRRGLSTSKWITIGAADNLHVTSFSCPYPSNSPPKYWVSSWTNGTGYQDQWCYGQSTAEYPNGAGARCKPDGVLYKGSNYYYCKVVGATVGNASSHNYYWLLTDLDVVNGGRDMRSFVSAYNLSGGPNNNNDSAYYWNGSSWKWIPDC